MSQYENGILTQEIAIKEALVQIRQYLETDIAILRKQVKGKDNQIELLQEELVKVQQQVEGNRQLINKLLGDLSKLQNDIEWYKRTYEKRSLIGTLREKLFRK